MKPAARRQNQTPFPARGPVSHCLDGGAVPSNPNIRFLAKGENGTRRKVRRGKGSKANPCLISKEDYLHTGTSEKETQTRGHNLRKLSTTSFSSQDVGRCEKGPTSIKTNGSNEKTKHVSDLVFDCVVLVRLHGLRGIRLFCIGELTLRHRRSRLALLIGGGDRLIDFHLYVFFSRLSRRLRLLLGSRRRGLGLFLGRV